MSRGLTVIEPAPKLTALNNRDACLGIVLKLARLGLAFRALMLCHHDHDLLCKLAEGLHRFRPTPDGVWAVGHGVRTRVEE